MSERQQRLFSWFVKFSDQCVAKLARHLARRKDGKQFCLLGDSVLGRLEN